MKFKKFKHVKKHLDSSMKSVGEVTIGRNFEETIQKAIRMIDDSSDSVIMMTRRYRY